MICKARVGSERLDLMSESPNLGSNKPDLKSERPV